LCEIEMVGGGAVISVALPRFSVGNVLTPGASGAAVFAGDKVIGMATAFGGLGNEHSTPPLYTAMNEAESDEDGPDTFEIALASSTSNSASDALLKLKLANAEDASALSRAAVDEIRKIVRAERGLCLTWQALIEAKYEKIEFEVALPTPLNTLIDGAGRALGDEVARRKAQGELEMSPVTMIRFHAFWIKHALNRKKPPGGLMTAP
jgi:hypothetical protein